MQRLTRKIVGVLAITVAVLPSFGQEQKVELNLNKVLELGKANNLTIKLYQAQQVLATADLTKAREWWLPDLNVGARTHWLKGSAMNGNGVFFTDVDRNNLWIGAGLDASWDFGNEVFKTKSARLLSQASKFRTEQAQNDVLLSSIESYFDLLLADVQIASYGQLIEQSDAIITQLKAQVDGGLRYQSELLLAKSSRSLLKMKQVNSVAERTILAAQLIELLVLNSESEIEVTEKILAPIELIAQSSEGLSSAEVYEKMPLLKMYDLRNDAIIAKRKEQTWGMLLPTIQFQVYGSLFGGYSSALRPTGETNAAVGWNIPLSLISGGDLKRSKSLETISDLSKQAEQQKIASNLYRAKNRLSQLKERMGLASEAQEFASQALEQSTAREDLGTAQPFEVYEAQQVYMEARMEYLSSIADYNKEQYRLYVALGNVL
ncbi:MAG: outer membrane protein [Bacteroidia bacterium]|jgi:outer membrane protein